MAIANQLPFTEQPKLRTPNIPSDDERKKKEAEEKARRRAEARHAASQQQGPQASIITADFAGQVARPSAKTTLGGV